MRVYFISKKSIIKTLVMIIMLGCVISVCMQYKSIVVNVFSSAKEIPIYSVDTTAKSVSITFDCAWGGEDIPKILDVLNKYKVKATFFLVGDWMNKYPDKVKLIDINGHDVANHSDTHPDMTSLAKYKMEMEIANANNKIQELTGKKNILFRAPYGAYNNLLVKTAKGAGLYPIQWDVDSLDWKNLGVEAIVSRVTSKVKGGSIILLHNDTQYTLDSLPQVIENLSSKGYQFVKVSDLIIKENYYIDYEGKQHNLIKESFSID